MRNVETKQETRVDKINESKRSLSRLKSTELSGSGIPKDAKDASLVLALSDSQSRREKLLSRGNSQLFVPVVSSAGKPLMPTTNWRADELIKKGRALRRFSNGLFYIKLLNRKDGEIQEIACGIDPGTKREAFTIKSQFHTYLNILEDAVTWVEKEIASRKMNRMARRRRKTPCRLNRWNKTRGKNLAPGIKARWQEKLRVLNIMSKLFPIKFVVIEDLKAKTKMRSKNSMRWNKNFSPIEVGKNWFYEIIAKSYDLSLKQGYETKELRDTLNLKKTSGKMDAVFSAHNVDSWVLANCKIGGHQKPDNINIFRLAPLKFHRRLLHVYNPAVGGLRRKHGGTMSRGLKRGSLIKHPVYGVTYLGGTNAKNDLSLHDLGTGERLTHCAKKEDITLLCYNKWRNPVMECKK